MNCIIYRPSARFFQVPVDQDARSAEGRDSNRDAALPQTGGTSSITGASRFGFHSKDERLAHVEALNSMVLDVTISSDVVGHMAGGHPASVLRDPLSVGRATMTSSPQPAAIPPEIRFCVSVPSNSNVNSTIGIIFDSWLEHRRRSGLSHSAAHPDSLYSHLANRIHGGESLPAGLAALGTLEFDLSLAISDASGLSVKRLKRVYVPKGSNPSPTSPSPVMSPSFTTPSSLGSSMIARHCALTGKMVAQKSIVALFASYFEVSGDGLERNSSSASGPVATLVKGGKQTTVTPPGEAQFKPPFFVRLYISDEAAVLRRMMLKEHVLRLRLESEVFHFISGLMKPFWDQCLQPDTQLRLDWIVYESMCRSRLAQAEIQSRWESQLQTLHRCEAERRHLLHGSETDVRNEFLGKFYERLMFCTIALASRDAMVNRPEHAIRVRVATLFAHETRCWSLITACRCNLEDFRDRGIESLLLESWSAMANTFHESFKRVGSS